MGEWGGDEKEKWRGISAPAINQNNVSNSVFLQS